MLETQTKQILCNLLLQHSKVEKQIEVVRQLLCEQVNFIPFSAFQKLDTQGNNAVLPSDLRDFLNNLGFPHTIAEAELAIQQYDTQTQLKMNYNEFLRATLTIDNIKLRNTASQRTPQDYLQGSKHIPYDVEYTLAKLFELEIRCNIDLEQQKQKLNSQRDYNTANAFAAIDLDQNQTLLPRDFEQFFKDNGYKAFDDEIQTMFRRIDFDNDGTISFNDFIKATSPSMNFSNQKPFDNNISAIGFNNTAGGSKGFNSTAGSKSPVKGILKSPQRSVYKNNSPVRTQDSFKYDIQKMGLQDDLEKSKIMNASFQNTSQINPIDQQYQQQVLQQSFQERKRIEDEIQDKEMLNRSISKEIEYQQKIKREQDKQLELERQIRIENEIKQEAEIQRQIELEKDIQKQKAIENQLLLEEMQRKQELAKQEEMERQIILSKMQRQQQLERSIEKMHSSIRRQQADLNLLRNKSPRAGQIVTRTEMSRSPAKKESYSIQRSRVEKQLHKDVGKSQILDQTYIAQKQTVSSKNKYTPKKMETYQKKGFTPNRMPNDYYSPEKTTVQSSTKKSNNKFTPNKSMQSNKKYQDPHNVSMTQMSKNIDNNQSHYNDFSGDKYSKLKANIRGKMANIRQSTEFQGNSDFKQNMNQSQGSFRTSSAAKSQTMSRKQSAKKVPSSFTRSTIGFDNSSNKGYSNKKQQQQMNSTAKKSVTSSGQKRQSMGTIDYSNSKKNESLSQVRQKSLSSMKKQGISSNQSSGLKQQQQSSSKKRVYSSRRQRVNDELIEMIQSVVNQEKKIERYKQDLALRPDFNLMDIFRYVDTQSRGQISSLLLEDFLKELKIPASIDEIFLFMRRYDTDNDGKLRFSDFAECITPKQPEYAQILERREAVYPNFELSIEEILSIDTIKLLKTLLKAHFECEIVMENLRKQIQRSPNFDYHEGFKILDIDDEGFINTRKILVFFQRNGQVITEKEVDYFISRFDKLGDKLVTFGEFVEELSPRSIKL